MTGSVSSACAMHIRSELSGCYPVAKRAGFPAVYCTVWRTTRRQIGKPTTGKAQPGNGSRRRWDAVFATAKEGVGGGNGRRTAVGTGEPCEPWPTNLAANQAGWLRRFRCRLPVAGRQVRTAWCSPHLGWGCPAVAAGFLPANCRLRQATAGTAGLVGHQDRNARKRIREQHRCA